MKKIISWKIIFFVLFLLVITNIAFLDGLVIGGYFNIKNDGSSVIESKIYPSISDSSYESLFCPSSCIAKIEQATMSSNIQKSEERSDELPFKNKADSDSDYSGAREFFVSFGGGSNSTDDWVDVPGLQAYVDSTKYGRIKSAAFEASVHIPTGNQTAYIRLYSVTEKHPVWNSEVSIEGGTPKLLISGPITLAAGKALYQVQMKTQLKFTAVLDQSRLHITTY